EQPDQVSGESGSLKAGKAVERPTILVTGGASQVGRRVLARLSGRGQSTIALQHRQPVPALEHVAIAHGDLSGDQLPRLDAAQMVHISAIWMLPENLSWLAHCGLCRLVCFSSTSILSKAESSSPYERDFAERLGDSENQVLAACEKLGIDCVILRPTMIYGLGIDRNISRAARFIERFGFYPFAMRADGLRQPVHADDLAAACLSVLDARAPLHGVYEVGGGETLPYDEMIGRVFDVLGRPRRFLGFPTARDHRRHGVADGGRPHRGQHKSECGFRSRGAKISCWRTGRHSSTKWDDH
ncbi:MAG: NAD-dependent epimerase/dehydratase family protein, partial [Alphaproteobacteria bacterium]